MITNKGIVVKSKGFSALIPFNVSKEEFLEIVEGKYKGDALKLWDKISKDVVTRVSEKSSEPKRKRTNKRGAKRQKAS